MRFFYFLFFVVFVIGCNQPTAIKSNETKSGRVEPVKSLILESKSPLTLVIGKNIELNFKTSGNEKIDSILVKVDYKTVTYDRTGNEIIIHTDKLKTGKRKITVTSYSAGVESASGQMVITLLSDIIPERYTYKIIKTLPHNTQWYTQGLEFNDGVLFEGTGLNGESGLFKVNVEKNEILQSLNLTEDVFGEGITILNDKVYQLTWRSQVGFVYDKKSLKKLYEFNYPTEGWGFTNNGKELIMSDGSENVYFLDTEFIQEDNRIEVYDDKGPVRNLNELELVDGLLYANIYQTDIIVAIDINTGKVIRRINMTGILDKDKITSKVDVLNGIAYNPLSKKWYVTGKWWPYMFQVEWVKQ